ncbi:MULTISPECIES: alpha/beta fold hydrolase [Paenibacillus]|uniref:alpha/beta fold hydrolase n=1 Tax=Paenibacillus TaxID=44249 RepID=UPI0004F86B7A|nr:alpha/beta hydrolase [Paenibacillus odorifer]AIQ74636.1 alpha/beta hydrolase [Paenibacillus odorifer]MEC0134064.1 alpha/beta hydrolase [Paenibacillus odorifer]MEC0222650.1 alpha/beta hydrolase [Paenibacillus odorifer]OMD15028.1 alpha/beta hydrolase [Paenibacillus odorifer]OMD28570.1 alpha/beta hydrolase [Paenibacillus odorifer]
MKKTLLILLKVIVAIVILLALFLVIVFTVNVISNKVEKGKIEPYGQLVPVDGKKMNVTIQGQGKETVVLLPGFGTASPVIDFKPLVDELTPFYKVVVVEPFGYGLSDVTTKERTVDNIVSELHEALQELKIDRYILMGHSIAGIYGLDYVNKYENEVSAFVGIDSSVPTQGGNDEEFPSGTYKLLKKSGFMRLLVKLNPAQIVTPSDDEETKEQDRMISLKNMMNPNIISEAEHFKSNFKATETLNFPKDLPVIFFLVKDNTDVPGWESLHKEQINDSLHGKLMLLDGEHYLHHTRSKDIVENFRSFLGEIK